MLSLEFLAISKIIPKSSFLAIIAKISLEVILIDSSKFKISEHILSLHEFEKHRATEGNKTRERKKTKHRKGLV